MNFKKITVVAAAVCLCLAMAGCGENVKKNAKPTDKPAASASADKAENNTADEPAPASEDVTADTDETSEAPASMDFQPTQQIKDATLSSGYVQIANDVFKEGGYMTVGEFVEKYGDRWDCSEIDLTMEADSKFFRFLKATLKGTDLFMEMVATAPVSGSGTVADAVIMCFKSEGGIIDDNLWLPGGICHHCTDQNYDGMIAMYEAQGCTLTDELFHNGHGVSKYSMTKNVGSYCAIPATDKRPYDSTYCLVELDEVNLYGEKPVIGYYFLDMHDGEAVYFTYNWIYYGSDDVYQWS